MRAKCWEGGAKLAGSDPPQPEQGQWETAAAAVAAGKIRNGTAPYSPPEDRPSPVLGQVFQGITDTRTSLETLAQGEAI